ncbi:hypothetical protein LEP1GSC082_4260 [Leptospira kirschneri str. H2]|nr:hypothetical protein LEP1GSC082_4260 [Leptospira kirschneri str. H2]
MKIETRGYGTGFHGLISLIKSLSKIQRNVGTHTKTSGRRKRLKP